MRYAEFVINSEGPLNTLSSSLLEDLRTFIRANKDKAIFISSAKKDFAAGADVTGFLPIFKQGKEVLREYLESVHALFDELENHPKPTFALINGVCFGGALELALACDYRFAKPDAKFSFPEVKLGIIPGWGGCVRTPRLIGFENAATLITTGKVIKADEALHLGLVDSVSEEFDYDGVHSFAEAGPFWRRDIKEDPMPYVSSHERDMAYATIKAAVWPKAKHYTAPKEAVEVMKDGLMSVSAEAAKHREIDGILKCVYEGQATQMIKLFFADKKIPREKPDTTLKVGVIGAGVMGRGIAIATAKGGAKVIINDVSTKSLTFARDEIRKVVKPEVMDRIGFTSYLDPLADCDIIIEAAVEDLAIKNEIFSNLQAIGCKGLIASNTSTIPIEMMPKCDIGIHYFNPVHKMPLVEIITTENTTEEHIKLARTLAATQRKTPIVVKSCAGFLVNRCLIPYLNTCIRHIDEGVNYKELDKIATDYGWPMGPATLLDTIGLDIAAHVAPIMVKAYPKNTAMQMNKDSFIVNFVKEGKLGNKSELGGIYSNLNCGIIGDAQTAFDEAMLAFKAEVKTCLDEGIVGSEEEALMAMIMGLGFPPFKELK